ncbi:MAG: bile acid:sodium symporter family protein [Pseudomonadales bacterium]|nr:bile acid:sodium symporter family protein [Pseudomonadales bacterium]
MFEFLLALIFNTHTALSAALILMMFAMGLGLKLADFKGLWQSPRLLITTVCAQLILLPLIALSIGLLTSSSPAISMGLLLVALCPSGSTSNFFCKLGQGNLALSISLTAVISLVTVVSLPLILFNVASFLNYAASDLSLSMLDTMRDIAMHTLLPVSVGMLCREYKEHWVLLAERWVVMDSSVLFFIVIGLLWWENWSHISASFFQAGSVTLLLLFTALGLGAGLGLLINVNQRDRFTMMMEVGIQNGALAFFIAVNSLNDMALLAPATVYTVAMVLAGAVLVFIRLKRLA